MIYNNLIGKAGRLGNQLWEVASTFGLASRYQTEPRFNYWEYTQFFNAPGWWFAATPEYEHRGDRDVYTLPDVEHMGPHKVYLQDYSLFSDYADDVRRIFEPSIDAECELARPDLSGFWALPEPKLALHIRRGDNATAHERNERGYHPVRPMSYYRDALDQLDGFASVVVFSDDLPWCRENVSGLLRDWDDTPVYFFEGGPARSRESEERYLVEPVLDWIDLLAMATCDRFILSNSSYSWWGAFLSGVDGSHIRHPDASVFFGSKLSGVINASLMFPPDWVPVLHPAGD